MSFISCYHKACRLTIWMHNVIWNNAAPLTIFMFSWRLLCNRLPTKDNLFFFGSVWNCVKSVRLRINFSGVVFFSKILLFVRVAVTSRKVLIAFYWIRVFWAYMVSCRQWLNIYYVNSVRSSHSINYCFKLVILCLDSMEGNKFPHI